MPENLTLFWEKLQIFIKDYVVFPLKSLSFIDVIDILLHRSFGHESAVGEHSIDAEAEP